MHPYLLPQILRLGCPVILFVASSTSDLTAARKVEPSDQPRSGPLTIEELFRPAFLGQSTLSPNGRRLGAIVTGKDASRNLLFLDLETHKSEALKATDGLDVGSFRWVNDREVLFNVSRDKLYSFGLYHATLGQLSHFKAFNAFDLTRIIGIPRNRPDRALVWLIKSAQNTNASSQLVELNTKIDAFARSSSIPESSAVKWHEPPKDGTVIDWSALENGELGYCLTYHARKTALHRYDQDKNTWHLVNLDLERYRVVAGDPDCHSLWVSHYSPALGFVLQRYDPVTDVFAEPVWHDSEYDLSGAYLYFSKKTNQLAGLAYPQRKLNTTWFLEPFASAYASLQEKFPEADILLAGFDESEQSLLYLVTGAQDPGRLLLLNLAQKKLTHLSAAAPWLQGRPLQPTHAISYKTRDGLKQEGYLTLPPGASAQSKVPLVILAHGGPWVRDLWQFNPTVQFLASRGYAVLQPNYRGSAGYSPAISAEHRFDFRKMHDDVTDAARAGAHLEMIDGSRLAIMGSSFGGYLALAGVAFEPGLYRCAVSFAGVFDWERLVKDARDSNRPGEYEQLRDYLGQPGKDQQSFAEYSPLRHVVAIKAPVFIAHGREDNIVNIAQSKKLASALKAQGSPHEVFLIDDTAHGPGPLAGHYEYFRRVEAFLAQYLCAPSAQKP
jgi:dipeptidyl aminopeptidase/acylaminoacyl peptidase